jgi:hypothetical protein
MLTPPTSGQSESTLEYRQLRLYYDMAFREWIAQARRRQDSIATPDPDADHALETSAAAVRDYRDRIVDFLLTNPHTSELTELQVREAAYFRWLNAGRPVETALPDWLAAQRQLASPRRLRCRVPA